MDETLGGPGPDDAVFMDEALGLAVLGRGRVHPNPLVGAVIVAGGAIVGRGAHLGPGLPHAEIVALREAGERAAGATLYCTLEPCSHHGRTPPCADAVIAAGVTRVVIAMQDPNPLVNGAGVARLAAAGVRVDLAGETAAERAAELNRPFVKYVGSGLPYVTYKAAVSLDGKVAAAGGDARWISSEESRTLVHEWRAAADVVLIGAGTLRRDDPLLTVRTVAGRQPVRAVATRAGELPLDRKLFASTAEGPVLVLAERMPDEYRRALLDLGVEPVLFRDGLEGALRTLADRGLLDVLCEGGPGLAGALLAEGLVDRIAFFVAPLLLGRGAPELLALPAPTAVAEGLRLAGVTWRQVGDDLLVEGRPERRARTAPAGGDR